MADLMTFPDTWEEFEQDYGFTDVEQVYTNGSRLIQSFRVKQWLDHISDETKAETDTISRQALMKEFSDFVRASNSSDFAQTPTWNDAVSLVGSMPSAQPERKAPISHKEQLSLDCSFCRQHERGDTLYESSDWDGGIGFDYIRNIRFCPICGRELYGNE